MSVKMMSSTASRRPGQANEQESDREKAAEGIDNFFLHYTLVLGRLLRRQNLYVLYEVINSDRKTCYYSHSLVIFNDLNVRPYINRQPRPRRVCLSFSKCASGMRYNPQQPVQFIFEQKHMLF